MISIYAIVKRAGATALVYHHKHARSCTEAEAEEWLRKRRIKAEMKKCLITDDNVSRGWEASHVLVVALQPDYNWENLVMRTVGYCALVRRK